PGRALPVAERPVARAEWARHGPVHWKEPPLGRGRSPRVRDSRIQRKRLEAGGWAARCVLGEMALDWRIRLVHQPARKMQRIPREREHRRKGVAAGSSYSAVRVGLAG